MIRSLCRPAVLASLACLANGCSGPSDDTLFRDLAPEVTGVTFENRLAEGADFNILNYLYYYNGGGVALGDLDGDDRPDLYLTSNEGPNALYLNRTEPGGPIRFEDVTEAAGVAGTSDWTTGVTVADVDGDGRLDLYVSALGAFRDRRGRNELFLNEGTGSDGLPRFREAAAEVGLDFEGFGTQAVFFDADRDGDLDAYLLNHAVHTDRSYKPPAEARLRDERSGDRLYRNDGEPGALPRFVEVTEAAGIRSGINGYGLAVVASDLDGDGWPDLYIGNDFHENDLVYLNNRDGTFREVVETAMPHTSRFSMGADAGDLDGDGRPDLVVLDMLPSSEAVRQTSAGDDTYALAQLKRGLGYNPQLARNTLQLNRGLGPDGIPRFSDVAYLAGIEGTDWSWASLLGDYDLDGRLDLFVTNGILRRPNDLDYIDSLEDPAIQQALAEGISEDNLSLLETIPPGDSPNAAFRNAGGLRFEPVTEAWGLGGPGLSNGAAHADLDGDGDLDLVVNNVNAPASVFENTAADRGARSLVVRLDGEGPNTGGVGARVTVETDGVVQTAEAFSTRGFQSAVDGTLVFALPDSTATVRVTWPDGRAQTLDGVDAGVLVLRQVDAGAPPSPTLEPDPPPPFTDVSDALALPFVHRENVFVDFNRERLMPHFVSREGPALAVGDVDGDGLDDLFVGGARDQAARLFVQRGGRLVPVAAPALDADSTGEDVAATLFDADGDGDLDLVVGTAGNEFRGEREPILERFYRNGPTGFVRDTTALPPLYGHTGTVAAADYDGDGDVDLFVGRRVEPRAYGRSPRSVLLENDGTGRFADVTDAKAPGLATAGMTAASAWVDLDGDGRLDLVTAGEWSPVRTFRNTGSSLDETTGAAGLSDAVGWWTALAAADLDGDGDTDLALGNLGLNSRIRATPEQPARLTLGDFDRNDQPDAVVSVWRDGDLYPVASSRLLRQTFPGLRERYPTFTAFGAQPIATLFPNATVETIEATTFASAIALNDGTGRFTLRPLPALAQVEPVYALSATDLDGDGILDLVLGGGQRGVRPDRGAEDTGIGLALRGDASGDFVPLGPEAGLVLDGEVRGLRWLRRADGGRWLVVARNDAPLQVLDVRTPEGLTER